LLGAVLAWPVFVFVRRGAVQRVSGMPCAEASAFFLFLFAPSICTDGSFWALFFFA
jgi:hypothetical protein